MRREGQGVPRLQPPVERQVTGESEVEGGGGQERAASAAIGAARDGQRLADLDRSVIDEVAAAEPDLAGSVGEEHARVGELPRRERQVSQ